MERAVTLLTMDIREHIMAYFKGSPPIINSQCVSTERENFIVYDGNRRLTRQEIRGLENSSKYYVYLNNIRIVQMSKSPSELVIYKHTLGDYSGIADGVIEFAKHYLPHIRVGVSEARTNTQVDEVLLKRYEEDAMRVRGANRVSFEFDPSRPLTEQMREFYVQHYPSDVSSSEWSEVVL